MNLNIMSFVFIGDFGRININFESWFSIDSECPVDNKVRVLFLKSTETRIMTIDPFEGDNSSDEPDNKAIGWKYPVVLHIS